MKNEDSMKRLKAMAKTLAELMKEQEAQKAREADAIEEDDMDLAADMLMDASDFLEEASNLIYQAAAILKGEDIEAFRSPSYVVEVCCDDEL